MSKMRKTLIILLVGVSFSLAAQNYAGENQDGCSGTGIVIGIPDPNPEYCYKWGIADGLTAEQIHQQRPVVKPNKTTTYSVTVTDPDFSFRAVDEVEVTVDFGGVKFAPKYILPNGENNQSKATLTVNKLSLGGLPRPFTWTVDSDPNNTKCEIDQSGWISKGESGGKVTIRATLDDNDACFAEEIIDVNVGVKDLVVRDVSDHTRVAHDKDTLYIVGAGSVEFEAIPNEESSFPQGQPEWTGDLSPPPGNDFIFISSIGIGTYTVSAGDRTVTVISVNANPISVAANIDLAGLKKFSEMFKKPKEPTPDEVTFCSPIPPEVTLPAAISIGITSEVVPKYKSPDIGDKNSVSLTLPAIGVSGCLPLPCCSATFPIPVPGVTAKYYVYLRGSAGLSFNINIARDESLESDAWDGQAKMSGSAEVAAGAAFDLSVGLLGFTGGAEAVAKAGVDVRYNDTKLEYQAYWGGVQAILKGTLYYMSPSETIQFGVTKGPWQVVDGDKSNWSLLLDFTSL